MHDPIGVSSRPSAGQAAWFLALSIRERLALLSPPARLNGKRFRHPASSRRLLAEWRAQSPFQREGWFDRRLSSAGVDESAFLASLGESGRSLQRRCDAEPEWFRTVAAAFDSGPEPAPQAAVGEESQPFLATISPLLRHAGQRVERAAAGFLARTPTPLFKPREITEALLVTVRERLHAALVRTAVLELHVARLRGQLAGSTAEERFQGFVGALSRSRRALAFLREYPVLARVLVTILELWVESSVEFLARLTADGEHLGAVFCSGRELGQVQAVEGGAGDSHCGGRSVKIVTFTSGLRVVYKPRSLAVDHAFNGLVHWMNRYGPFDLRVPAVLSRESYGWCEHIPHEPCENRAQIERFYRRQGSLLAILYALNANDFHRENLIACGEHPVPVDLESLCEGEYRRPDGADFETAAACDYDRSVVRVMLLPFLVRRSGGLESYDPSGLGGGAGQRSLFEGLAWEGANTDLMRAVRRRFTLAEAENRPRLVGEVNVNPLDLGPEIVQGFTETYRFLASHRERLLADDGPLAAFRSARVRFVFRATQLYSMILEESYHPDLLRNAVERDRIFDRLWHGLDISPVAELALRLLPWEREDLWREDVPYFSAIVDSHDVQTSTGETIPGVFFRTGWEMVCDRLDGLSEADLDRQLWYVRCSLAALAASSDPQAYSRYRTSPEIGEAPSRERLLKTAAAIARRLAQLAKVRDGEASWLGLIPVEPRGWQLAPLDLDLYGGHPGIALFLAYFGWVAGDDEATDLARATWRAIERQWRRRGSELRFIGGYSGWGGAIYTCIHLAWLWRRDDLLAHALTMASALEPLIDRDEELDLTFGAAGGIVPLLALHRAAGAAEPLALARKMGDRLVALAQPWGAGLAWRSGSHPHHPLAGFSHGLSGQAWALLRLFEATGDERYRETALRALACENGLFSVAAGNWPDFRQARPEDPPQTPRLAMAAWCHGATGIGLARLRMRSHLAPDVLRHDLESALAATLEKGFGWNHCLCHGDLGSLELLLEAALHWDAARWAPELCRRTSQVLASMEENGWVCGVPMRLETPGLMEGLAGIGYGLLRLAERDRVPSLLLLDPPPSQG